MSPCQGSPAALPEEPYGDIGSLIRATHGDLVRAAFRFLGNRADAEDAAQEGCIKVMRSWSRVSGLATARQQRAYLLKAVMNEALQIRRRPHRERERLGFDREDNERGAGACGAGSGYEDDQAAGEQLRLVLKAIGELPEGCREVVILFAAGYEYREIAAMLGVHVSTVRSHVSNARKQLPRAAPGEEEGGRK